MVAQRRGPVTGTPAEAAVFLSVLTQGPVARADIARLTGLSGSAVTRVSRGLLDSGYLEPVDGSSGRDGGLESAAGKEENAAATEHVTNAQRLGRPMLPLKVNADHTATVGFKLTEDAVIGVVCDLSGEVRTASEEPLPDTSVETALDVLAGAYGRLQTEAAAGGFARTPARVGVSLSGDIDDVGGRVRYSPFLGWRDVSFGAMLSDRLQVPVVLENDVKALTGAEQWFGLGRGIADFALVTIGAGIGCALVVGGSLVHGANSVAGEIGHLPLGDRDVICHCGGRGCVEALASTTALVDAARESTGIATLTEEQAVELARSGDQRVGAIFERAGRLVGLAIASVANILGPAQVIVAGEAVSRYDLFESAIREAFAQQAFGAAGGIPVLVRDLPFREWARGAATRAIEDLVFPTQASGRSVTHIPATGVVHA